MEAGEYALTRGTCFLACRLELVAVAGLLWLSWCVLGGVDFFAFLFRLFFFFERTRPAAIMRPPYLIYLSTSNAFKAKNPLHTGVSTGCHYLISVSVCVCVTFVIFTDCESCTRPISTNPVPIEAGEYGLTCGTWFSRAVSRWSRSLTCCGFRGVFRVGGIFAFFFRSLLRTHTACCNYEAALPHLPLY